MSCFSDSFVLCAFSDIPSFSASFVLSLFSGFFDFSSCVGVCFFLLSSCFCAACMSFFSLTYVEARCGWVEGSVAVISLEVVVISPFGSWVGLGDGCVAYCDSECSVKIVFFGTFSMPFLSFLIEWMLIVFELA